MKVYEFSVTRKWNRRFACQGCSHNLTFELSRQKEKGFTNHEDSQLLLHMALLSYRRFHSCRCCTEGKLSRSMFHYEITEVRKHPGDQSCRLYPAGASLLPHTSPRAILITNEYAPGANLGCF